MFWIYLEFNVGLSGLPSPPLQRDFPVRFVITIIFFFLSGVDTMSWALSHDNIYLIHTWTFLTKRHLFPGGNDRG